MPHGGNRAWLMVHYGEVERLRAQALYWGAVKKSVRRNFNMGGRASQRSKCSQCDNISEDDCRHCGKPTCRTHGKSVRSGSTTVFVCKQCVDEVGRA